MKKNIAIKVENLSKMYEIGSEQEKYLNLRDQIVSIPRKIFSKKKGNNKTFWALKDISIEVKKGEVLGIIGKNGAGKSTLLKILSKIVEPTSGIVTMKGRVASLLEVGTGFSPELTGRENISLSGAIMGMTNYEIDDKFDSIVEFSGIGKFIDTPVKKYSSGMYVRLAFSVAAHLNSEILLLDEVLSVGDTEFQEKSKKRMYKIKQSNKTIIYISHNVDQIRKICDRVLFLDKGKTVEIGATDKVINMYQDNHNNTVDNTSFSGSLKKHILFKGIAFKEGKNNFDPSENVEINIKWFTKKKHTDFKVMISIYTKQGVRVFTTHDVEKKELCVKGHYVSNFIIPKLYLRPGKYRIGVGGHINGGLEWMFNDRAANFAIKEVWTSKNKIEEVGIVNIEPIGSRSKNGK